MTAQRVITMTAGVYFREFDISQYIRNLTATKLALVGVASRGEVDKEILITSLQQGFHTVGIPNEDYPALLVMREFFNAGGGEVHFVRVANGDLSATVEVDQIDGLNSSVFTATTTGSFFNDITLQISYGNQLPKSFSQAHTFPALTRTTTVTIGGTITAGDIVTLTITDAAVTGSPIDLDYTVLVTDTTADIAAGLNALLNAHVDLQAALISSTVLGSVLTIVSSSPNATAYSYAVSGAQTETVVIGATVNDLTDTFAFTLTNVPLVPGTVVVKFGVTQVAKDDLNGVLVFSAPYNVNYSGTVDYNTGEVEIITTSLTPSNAVTVNVSYNHWSTFNLQIRQKIKDENDSVVNQFVLESYIGLTPSTIETVIANSRYVDIDGEPVTFPLAGSYPMTGGDDGKDNITDADFVGNIAGPTPTGLQVFAFPDQIDINVVAVPGVASLAVREALQQLTEVNRADTLALYDPPQGLDVLSVTDWANGENTYSTYNTLDTNYGAIYYPHYTTFNSVNNANESTPPSAAAVQALAKSDPWQAPAGPNRGTLTNIIDIDTRLNPNDRAYLDANRINSISRLNGLGEMILGQRTATLTASSLDRVAARRMLMRIEKAITTALYPLLFEPNTTTTWNRAIMIAQPYLDSLVAKEQIYKGIFYCDNITNTVETINNNQMVAICELQLLKYAEIIVVNFLVTALGTTITEQSASIITAL